MCKDVKILFNDFDIKSKYKKLKKYIYYITL